MSLFRQNGENYPNEDGSPGRWGFVGIEAPDDIKKIYMRTDSLIVCVKRRGESCSVLILTHKKRRGDALGGMGRRATIFFSANVWFCAIFFVIEYYSIQNPMRLLSRTDYMLS